MSATTTPKKPTPPKAARAAATLAAEPVEVPVGVPEPEAPEDGGRDEVERLDPADGKVLLTNGTLVAVEALRLRQFLKLLRILTRGASGVMDNLNLGTSQSSEAFVQQLLALVVLAIPEAENETVAFIQSMCRVDPEDTSDASDVDLYEYLQNPELEDMLSIIEVVVHREGADIQALGKRLGSMMGAAQKMGALKK